MDNDSIPDFQLLKQPVPITEERWEEDVKPLVSISCTAYNHESYIRDTIEGFLMQSTTFPVEILIHDDASTDNTSGIIRTYEKKYPNLILPLYQTENQYSQGIKPALNFQHTRIRGKYYAICEGDDYWTDPLKLQKQVTYLESHPDCSLVVGGYKKVDVNTNEEKTVISELLPIDENGGFRFELLDTSGKWLTKTLTACIRKTAFEQIDLTKYKYGKDVNFFYHILKNGYGYYLPSVLGVYRVHEGGVFSLAEPKQKLIRHFRLYKELFEHNKDEFTRLKYLNYVKSIARKDLFCKVGTTNVKLLRTGLLLIHSFQEFLSLIKSFIPIIKNRKLK